MQTSERSSSGADLEKGSRPEEQRGAGQHRRAGPGGNGAHDQGEADADSGGRRAAGPEARPGGKGAGGIGGGEVAESF